MATDNTIRLGDIYRQAQQYRQGQQVEAQNAQANTGQAAQMFAAAFGQPEPGQEQQAWQQAKGLLESNGIRINNLSDTFNQEQFNRIQGLAQMGAGQGLNLGQYNPRDYTTESWNEMLRSNDPTKLERYSKPQAAKVFQDAAGISYLQMGTDIKQLNTPEEIAAAKAFIREQESAAVARGSTIGKEQTPDAARKYEGAVRENEAVLSYINEFLDPTMGEKQQIAQLDLIYGRGESLYPSLIRSQEGVDAQAARDFIINNLSLENAQKLKGQGQITENEREMLNRAATILGNPDISPTLARRELMRVQEMFKRWRNENMARVRDSSQPMTQSKESAKVQDSDPLGIR